VADGGFVGGWKASNYAIRWPLGASLQFCSITTIELRGWKAGCQVRPVKSTIRIHFDLLKTHPADCLVLSFAAAASVCVSSEFVSSCLYQERQQRWVNVPAPASNKIRLGLYINRFSEGWAARASNSVWLRWVISRARPVAFKYFHSITPCAADLTVRRYVADFSFPEVKMKWINSIICIRYLGNNINDPLAMMMSIGYGDSSCAKEFKSFSNFSHPGDMYQHKNQILITTYGITGCCNADDSDVGMATMT
jgi:hypothetical protein